MGGCGLPVSERRRIAYSTMKKGPVPGYAAQSSATMRDERTSTGRSISVVSACVKPQKAGSVLPNARSATTAKPERICNGKMWEVCGGGARV